jgi:hypothetical protein
MASTQRFCLRTLTANAWNEVDFRIRTLVLMLLQTATMDHTWSEWMTFPGPAQWRYLAARFGPGCYPRRHGGQLVLLGMERPRRFSNDFALPPPRGKGTRNNSEKRNIWLYIFQKLNIEHQLVRIVPSQRPANVNLLQNII